MSGHMRQGPICRLVDETSDPAHVLDHLVVIVLCRNEFGAIEDGEELRIVDGEDRGLETSGKALAERLIDIAACNPVVVGIGRRLPDHRDGFGVNLAALHLLFPDEVIEHAHLVGTRLNELDRPAVVTGVADAREGFLRLLAQRLSDEMLGEEAAGGRCACSKGEGLALDASWKIFRELKPGRCVSNEIALELDVLRALREHLRVRHSKPCLHACQATEPGELHLIVGEGGNGRGIALDGKVFDGDAELGLEVSGVLGEALNEAGLILIGNRGENQRGLLSLSRARGQHTQESQSKNRSLEHSQLLMLFRRAVLRVWPKKGYGTRAVPMKATPERPIGPLPHRISRFCTNSSRTAGARSPRPDSIAAMPGANPMCSESQRAEGAFKQALAVLITGGARPALANSARKSPSSR